jgi:hypothetical protein
MATSSALTANLRRFVEAITFQIHGGPDHTVHELDLPDEYEKVASAEELHKRLREHLSKASPKR